MYLSLSIIFLLLISLSYEGTPTYCIDLFYKERNNITSFENTLTEYCINFLKGKNLNQTTGCLTCKVRLINGLFDINTVEELSSICITPTTASCANGDYTNMESLFNEFANTINTNDKILNKINFEVNITDVIIENENLISNTSLNYTQLKLTPMSLTYQIENKNNFPVKCYKYLSTTGRKAVKGDLSFVMKPTSINVMTDSLGYGDYDCKEYSLQFTCYSVPYIENSYMKLEFEIQRFKNDPQNGFCDPKAESQVGGTVATVVVVVVLVLAIGGGGFYYFGVKKKLRIADYTRMFGK